MLDLDDTIVALATARGGAPRGIVRLSGPRAWDLAAEFFRGTMPASTGDSRPLAVPGHLSLPTLAARVPATLFWSRAPHSFTGQDVLEIHTIGSPPILQLLLSTLLARGARQAIAGEFTMRAFLSGKLDLTAAEAVAGLIDATTPRQAAVALEQMAGGIAQPIHRLREQLLNLLAELEAGLDFTDEDLEFIDRGELRAALQSVDAELDRLGRQMRDRAHGTGRRRAVLLGPPNVGKSSLFNSLLGRPAALVSHAAGTTRDYLVGELRLPASTIELVDTAGVEPAPAPIGQQAQTSRERAAAAADLLLYCVESLDVQPLSGLSVAMLQSPCEFLIVRTKCDLMRPGRLPVPAVPAGASSPKETVVGQVSNLPGHFVAETGRLGNLPHADVALRQPRAEIHVSALTGAGLDELRQAIDQWVLGPVESEQAVVPVTAARCGQAIHGAHAAIDRASAALEARASDELIALDLRLALDELAHVVGAVFTDDLLDRIFSRFCIGK